MTTSNLLSQQGEVYLHENFFSEQESAVLYQQLFETCEWKQEQLKLYGKKIDFPRLTCWYGDAGISYKYSGINNVASPWTDALLGIKNKIEKEVPIKFNSVLLNLYRHGHDSMGWHSDDEHELGRNPVIASVSFGAERIFNFKHKSLPLKVKAILRNGSLLLMAGETQHYWFHAIPKATGIDQPRINLTFRKIST